jgi:hypothetical protein
LQIHASLTAAHESHVLLPIEQRIAQLQALAYAVVGLYLTSISASLPLKDP